VIKARKSLEKVTPYRLPLISRKSKIRLDLNESPFGCSPKVMEAIKSVGHEDISTYPEYQTLMEKIANYFEIKSENVLLTNGADDAIRCIIETYVEEKDEVMIPEPSYSMFDIFCKIRGAKILKVPCDKDLSFPTEKLLSQINERTRMIVLSNPGNPTGTSIKEGDLIKILKKGKIVLLDETYWHFAKKNYTNQIKEFDNLFVVQTFSKIFGIAGLRLGFLISDEENIKNITKVALPFAVNSLAVRAGIAALSDKKFVERVVKEMEKEKRFLCQELEKFGNVLKVHKTDTNFLLVDFGEFGNEMHKKLADKNVLVRRMDGYSVLNGFLRITVGKREDNLALLGAIEEAIPLKAILFDMDGVLVDVSSSYRLAIKETANHFLKEDVSPDEIEELKRKGYNNDWDLTEAIMRSHGLKVPRDEIIKKFQELYLGKNFDGFIKNERPLISSGVLKKLKKDYRLAIVTGRPKTEAEHALNVFEIRKYFDAVIAMEDVSEGKKEGIDLVLKKFKEKRGLYLGDNVDDVKAAISSGMIPVGVSSSDATEKILKKAGAKYVIRDVKEIIKILG
jgi:histidinol-phosphate aminotransferase